MNISRSAMAEAIVNEVYGDDYIASSAGISAFVGSPMCYDARMALVRAGYDEKKLCRHTARQISKSMISGSDKVICVSDGTADALRRAFPDLCDRITSFDENIRVPADGDADGYDECFLSLCAQIEKILYPGGSKWSSK